MAEVGAAEEVAEEMVGAAERAWQAVGFLVALAFVLLNVALAWVIAYKNILHKLPLLRKILHSLFNLEMKDAEPAARQPSEGVPAGGGTAVAAATRRPHTE